MKKVYLLPILILLHFFPKPLYSLSINVSLKYFGSDPSGCSPRLAKDYKPGKTKGGNTLNIYQSNPNSAIETDEDNHESVSLGFGGSIILQYEGIVPNLAGNDIKILETSSQDEDCSLRKVKVAVYASKDEVNWIYIGEGCQDLALDFPSTLNWAKFFKIIDISNPEDFTLADADGYHLDGIESTHCPNYPVLEHPVDMFVECVSKNTDGSYTANFGYVNPNSLGFKRDIGEGSNFISNITYQTQPIFFAPGRVHNAFSITFTTPSITWYLLQPDGVELRSVTAYASSTDCNFATIRGGGDICEGESALVYVDFEGTGPWSISYKDSEGNVTNVNDITQSPYSFISSKPTTYSLLNVSTEGNVGSVFGSATIQIKNKPTAVLSGNGSLCGNTPSTPLTVNLTGQAPFTLTYSDGTTTFEQLIFTNSYVFPGLPGKTYSLISIVDRFCSGPASGSIQITQASEVSATLSGSTTICGGSTAPVKIDFTGTSPWTITINNSIKDSTITQITTNPLILNLPVGYTYSLVSVYHNSCPGLASGSAIIANSVKPTGVISGGGAACAGGQAPVKITLTGEPPFNFTYTDGKVSFTQSGYGSNLFTFNGIAGKTYTLSSLNSQQCEGTVSGSAEIVVLPPPTATMSGSKYICSAEETSTVTINLNGSIPYTIIYTDGKNEIKKEGIISSPYSFEVTGEGRYKLISVKDAKCDGIVDGGANMLVPDFTATLELKDKYCFGSEIYLTPLIEGGDVLSYDWATTGKGYFFNGHNNTTRYIPGVGESGNISFTLTVIGKCKTQSFNWNTSINEKIDASFSFNPKEEILSGDPVKFTSTYQGANSYNWYVDTMDGATGNPFEHVFEQPGKYRIILAVEKDGCFQLDTAFVEVNGRTPQVFVPNIFSPFATSPESRVVKVYGEEISTNNFLFKIFNKWGNVLYQTTNFAEANTTGWDGRALGTGAYQPLGVYTYSVEGRFNNNAPFKKYGTVTLAK